MKRYAKQEMIGDCTMLKWFACLSCFTKFSDVIDDDCPHCGSDDTFEVVSNASMRRAFELKRVKVKAT